MPQRLRTFKQASALAIQTVYHQHPRAGLPCKAPEWALIKRDRLESERGAVHDDGWLADPVTLREDLGNRLVDRNDAFGASG
jgi:hypothetical protein